jgi:membrane fusion protein (multidrug efflux system)
MESQPEKKPSKKPLIIVVILLLIVFGGIFGFGAVRSYFMGQFFAHFAPPPATISTSKVKAETWKPSITTVGSLMAINGVQVTTQEAGMVERINFQSGQVVKKGESLVQLDDSEDLQDLKNYRAQLKLAIITHERQKKLYKYGAVATSGLDQAQAALEQAEAQATKTQIVIGKKNIKAPFDGKAGICLVNIGQYINVGSPLVSLQALDPLHVNFSLPEQNLSKLYVGQPITFTIEAQANKNYEGKITAINSEVNSQTRNILVQATVANPKLELYPGMFANIQVMLPQEQNVIVVPQTAITYNLYGDSVYVIQQDGTDKKTGKPIYKAITKYVTVGDKLDNTVIILKGLNAGEEVVTSGQLKLHNGSEVVINNSVELTPHALGAS